MEKDFLNHTQIVWFILKKLKQEIKSKDQIINHLLNSLEFTRYPNRNAVIGNTVTSPGLENFLQINQTGNSLKKEKYIDFEKEIIKSHSSRKNNEENNNISNISINSDHVEASLLVKKILENLRG